MLAHDRRKQPRCEHESDEEADGWEEYEAAVEAERAAAAREEGLGEEAATSTGSKTEATSAGGKKRKRSSGKKKRLSHTLGLRLRVSCQLCGDATGERKAMIAHEGPRTPTERYPSSESAKTVFCTFAGIRGY